MTAKNEWEGLPRPENIDPIARTLTITLEEKLALDSLMRAEANGRLRMNRYQQWICDTAGVPSWAVLHIIVESPRLNS